MQLAWMPSKFSVRKLEGKRIFGRPKCRQKDNVNVNLKKM
jgi:hypothetical protein